MNITYAHINSYLKGSASKATQALVEDAMEKDPKLMELINNKREEQTLMNSIIPQFEATNREIEQVKKDLELISEEIIQEDKKPVLQRVAKFLDTTIIEF